MKNSKKKSPVKSKKTITKNPLKKYIGGGPALGSSGFTPTYSSGPTIGSFYGNTTGFTPTTGNTFGGGTTFGSNNTFGSGTLGNNNYGFNTGSATGNNNYGFTPVDFNQVNADLGFNPSNSAYSGTDRTLDSTITPEFDGKQAAQEKIKEMGYGEYLDKKPKPQQMTKGEIATTALGAVPGTVGAIASLASSSKVNDPSGYYDKKTKAKLEQYNKKIKASSAASAVGSGLLATSAAWGPLAFIPAAAGAITMAAAEGAKASYQAKQGNLGTSYDERVANRIKYKESQDERRQEGLDRNAATNYYSQGSGLAKYGGMREFQTGGPTAGAPIQNSRLAPMLAPAAPIKLITPQMKADADLVRQQRGMSTSKPAPAQPIQWHKNGGLMKYMAGGYQKVTGPSHENGGIAMDLSGDGVNDAELEGGEIIEEMKHGGNAPKKYIWSDHLKTGGMSFAKKFEELRKGGARPGDVETLRVEQELAAKRDPSKLYAKYGGLTKYKTAGAVIVPPVPPTPPPSDRVSRTGAGKFFAEYGAPMASLAGGIGDIAMNLRQEYNPAETVNARELTADEIYIDRAKDKQAGFRESELRGAKRDSRAITGTGATQRENALRMTSLRAGEMAAQNIYDQNRQASTDEQKINLDAQMRVDEANRQTDIVESESRRNEGLRKESFENMRKKYIGSVAGQLGNELASGMYRKEYINATLPDGVNPYELKPGAYEKLVGTINPDTGKEYTPAQIWKAIHLKLAEERKS